MSVAALPGWSDKVHYKWYLSFKKTRPRASEAVIHFTAGYDTSYARRMHRTMVQGEMPI